MPKVGKPLPDPRDVACESPYQREMVTRKYCCKAHAHLAQVKIMRDWRVRVRDEANERWLLEV